MRKIQDFLKSNTNTVISVPAILCAIQFIMSLVGAVRTGIFDSNTVNQLLSTADGFESVVLFVTMLAIRDKKT